MKQTGGCSGRSVHAIRLYVLTKWHLCRLLPSHRDWELGSLYLLMITFQRDSSRFLRNTFLGCKTGERLGKYLHLKGAEIVFTMTSFLK